MINKVDMNLEKVEYLPFLNRFSKIQSLKQTVEEKISYLAPFEFLKKHKNYLSLLMSGVIIGGLMLVKNTPFYYGTMTVACLANTTNIATETGEKAGTVTQIWAKLEPLTKELMSGADVLGVLALIYCGMLLLMGQTNKGKKTFKNALTGFLLIRLAPLLIDIIGIFSNINLQ